MPAVHVTPGERLTVTVLPKGAGSENVSRIGMLLPPSQAGRSPPASSRRRCFLREGNPAPPVILGVGIGGTFDMAAALAKEALLLPVDTMDDYEQELCDAVNALGIGPMGARRRHDGARSEGEARRLPHRLPPGGGERAVLGLPPGDRGGEAVNLRTPLGARCSTSGQGGDTVTLSGGTIYTARDEAHLRMMEEGIPFDPEAPWSTTAARWCRTAASSSPAPPRHPPG